MKTFENDLSTDTVMNAGVLLVGIIWVVIAAFQGPLDLQGEGPAADVAAMAAPAVLHSARATVGPANTAHRSPGKIS